MPHSIASKFNKGDLVIYRMPKYSSHPGPRAVNVDAAPMGEAYRYEVDKFWVVEDIQAESNHITLKTRRGKRHQIPTDDPHLRLAGFWERFLYKRRFPNL